MERADDDLYGMTPEAAKEYIAAHLTTKLLQEKKLADLEAETAKWTERAALARGKGLEELAAAAEAEAQRTGAERDKLAAETADLIGQIERMRRQLPALASKQRTVDPDLLEQELRMAAGHEPGSEGDAEDTARRIAALEKESAAETQLAALKARMAPPKADPAE